MRLHPAVAALVVTVPAVLASAAPTERLDVPGLHAAVRIQRDVRGIPHLYAADEHDLYFGQGWVHAEDRLFQMDTTRRLASGTLAELFGAAVLASDVELRTIGLRRAAERSLTAISPAGREHLEAYAAGVNAWVASHPLPVEYGVLELTAFAPWTPVDSLVVAKAIAFSLSFDLDIDATVTLASYLAAGAGAGFDGAALYFADLHRSAPFDPASTVPDAGEEAAPAAARTAAPSLHAAAWRPDDRALGLAAGYLERVRGLPAFADAVAPLERRQGSNEWGVAGRHTADGRPLLANDPHLALDTPPTFHQIHLRAPAAGIDVIGSGFAGTPYVVLGQNRFVTWGATTNPLDVTDTYQELIVPDAASPSGLSTVHAGNLEPVLPIPQVFRVNQLDGVPDDLAVAPVPPGAGGVTLIVPRRNHGPLVAVDLAAGIGLSVQYTGFSATRELDTFRLWNRARGLDDFVAALQFFDFGSQNWAYADIRGNLAYFTSAEMPLREDLEAGTVAGLPPWFIRDGTGGNEWLPAPADRPDHHAVPYAILPFVELPQVVNPPAGWFVNANNDPAGTTLDNDPLNQLRPTGGLYYLNPGYADGLRAGRITELVREAVAHGHVGMADMAAIQADVVLLDASVFVPHLAAAWDRAGAGFAAGAVPLARVEEAVERLRHWDFSTPTGIEAGYDAADVDGFLTPPDEAEIAASVAATLHAVWRGQLIRHTIDATLEPLGLPGPGSDRAVIALRHLLENGGASASGLDFFAAGQGATLAERVDDVLLRALAATLERLAGPDFAAAFGGSADLDDYRWGLLHRVVFDHPLGGPLSIPPAGGQFVPVLPPALPGVPTDGGFGTVDASGHSARADSANEFMFGSGPVRRYVGRPGSTPGSIVGQTSLPGGESGVLGSHLYFNLLPGWLTNEAYPVLQDHRAIQQETLYRQILRPAR
jgi:penicillin amidase